MVNKKAWMTLVAILALVGGVNWILVGLFNWDLVAKLAGSLTWLKSTLYVLAGAAGAWLATKELM